MSQSVVLHAGAVFAFDGAVAEVTGLEGTRVTVRDVNNHWRTMTLTDFLRQAKALETRDTDPVGVGHVLAGLSPAERAALTERAEHVRETLTGYRSGSSQAPRPGEPRAQYDPSRSLIERQHAKAEELGITARTIRRWVEAYRVAGEAGLVDQQRVLGRSSTVDPRWETACRLVLAEQVSASTPTAQALLRQIEERLEEAYGPGEVPKPARASAYRHLKRIAQGTNALTGSAKGRRSIAARPKGVYGRLRATRPGEYVVLDTQDLDVYAMEPVTCRWVPVQLTVAQDLFDRCILGLRITAVSTKAVDVAGVLHEVVAGPATNRGTEAGRELICHGFLNGWCSLRAIRRRRISSVPRRRSSSTMARPSYPPT